jgi:hypothetical protein
MDIYVMDIKFAQYYRGQKQLDKIELGHIAETITSPLFR